MVECFLQSGTAYGDLAQLVEHIVHIDGVTGSSPVITTILTNSNFRPVGHGFEFFYVGKILLSDKMAGRDGDHFILPGQYCIYFACLSTVRLNIAH